jgi:hypothetical protein
MRAETTTQYIIMKLYFILAKLICLFRFSIESCDSKKALTDIISKMNMKMNVEISRWMIMSTIWRNLRESL